MEENGDPQGPGTSWGGRGRAAGTGLAPGPTPRGCRAVRRAPLGFGGLGFPVGNEAPPPGAGGAAGGPAGATWTPHVAASPPGIRGPGVQSRIRAPGDPQSTETPGGVAGPGRPPEGAAGGGRRGGEQSHLPALGKDRRRERRVEAEKLAGGELVHPLRHKCTESQPRRFSFGDSMRRSQRDFFAWEIVGFSHPPDMLCRVPLNFTFLPVFTLGGP